MSPEPLPHSERSSIEPRAQLVTDEYARAYEAGALAALDWIAGEYPNLAEPGEDCPSPTTAAAEHIGTVIDLMLGRSTQS